VEVEVEVPLQDTLFAVRLEAYLRCELGRLIVSLPSRMFEVFTAGTMKNAIFWDVMPFDSSKDRCFGGTHRLIVMVTRIGDVVTTLTVNSNRRTLLRGVVEE
jgi:hypothetical protein